MIWTVFARSLAALASVTIGLSLALAYLGHDWYFATWRVASFASQVAVCVIITLMVCVTAQEVRVLEAVGHYALGRNEESNPFVRILQSFALAAGLCVHAVYLPLIPPPPPGNDLACGIAVISSFLIAGGGATVVYFGISGCALWMSRRPMDED